MLRHALPMRAVPAALVMLLVVGSTAVHAQRMQVDRWLVLGPVRSGVPAFAPATDSTLLAGSALDPKRLWPAEGDSIEWLGGRSTRWTVRRADDGTPLSFDSGDQPAVAYAAAYIEADRWHRARIVAEGAGPRVIWVDGERVGGEAVVLTRGTHRLLVETAQPAGAGAWTLDVRIEPETPDARPEISLDPRHAPSWTELHAAPEIRQIRADPTGQRVAWLVRTLDTANDRWVTHLEIRRLDDGSLITRLRPGERPADPRWSRDGRRLAFTTSTDRERAKGRDLWNWSTRDGAVRLLRAERGLADLQWSPDGDWLYFTATVRTAPEETPEQGQARRLTEVWHRWDDWPAKRHLYAFHPEQGTRIELAGDSAYSVTAPALSPDGRRIVFTRDVRLPERPYIRSEVWLLDLGTRAPRKLLELDRQVFNGPSAYAWAPDGRAVAFCAGARELVEGAARQVSGYETELFATSIERPRLRHLSDGFTPSVGAGLGCRSLHWSPEDGRVYVAIEDGARTAPARTTEPPAEADGGVTLEMLSVPGEVMGAHDIAAGRLVAVVEAPVRPPAVYRMGLDGSEPTALHQPGPDALRGLALPEWTRWSFTNSDGREIEGWYWTPPDFDPSREYPTIVHYYGGTLARKMSFDERLLWYAANGYVVYMLNPAGAPGYGQDFSNLHIDDWGHPAGTDIIEGVTKFAGAHAFVDAGRIGNFGHSYGGFMTMHLLTRTDIFAASVELAGISNITGYWGAGWTGYSYTDGTCPGCFPWNRPDVYVDRSPIFRADRIRTPLLLMHGTEDTNVVPTESEQMFTALRALDREAELVRFHGEDHGIGSSPSVQRRRDTIMLEWYDKQLRDRPRAWRFRWDAGRAEAASRATAAGPGH